MSKLSDKYDSHNTLPQPNFKSLYFGTGIGYVIYYFLRNDWVWKRLTEQEKQFVKRQNEYWNNYNPGYEKPEEYQGQGGRSFRTIENREDSWQGKQIQLFLEKEQPNSVLEVGPGSGYYTRQIFEFESIKEYYATDINSKFLNYIDGAISEHPRRESVKAGYYQLDELGSLNMKVDAIILLSTIHHIPDRESYIKGLSKYLSPEGAIFFYEPMHSLTRIIQLARSFIIHGWFLTKIVKKRNNYMTHHFCTVSETKKIAKRCGMSIESWNVHSILPTFLKYLSAPFAKKMVAVLKNTEMK